MKNVIAGLVLVSLVTLASPAEARRWNRRATVTSTCPNGQCYQPVSTPAVESKPMAASPVQTADPAQMTTKAEPVQTEAVTACSNGQCNQTYVATSARRARVRWLRR